MAANIRKQAAAGGGAATGTDLDDVFAAYSSGTKAANCGVRLSTGQDLSDRYQPKGAAAKVPDVGYRNSAGSDITNLFAFFGYSPTVTLGYDGQPYLRTRDGPATTNIVFTFLTGGTWSVGGNGIGSTDSGDWLTEVGGGVASDYDALFTYVITTGSGGITNGATARTQISANRAFQVSVTGTSEMCVVALNAFVYRRSDNALVGQGSCELTAEVLTG